MTRAGCEALHAFLAGELAPAQADAFRDHLATCAACARELHDLMMVEALEQTHSVAQVSGPNKANKANKGGGGTGGRAAPAPTFRSQVSRLTAVVVPVLAAAAAWMLWAHGRSAHDAKAVVAPLETTPARATEVRLAYAAADAYRPYDVGRADGPRRHEDVPLAALAALESSGDLHGVGAGLLLSGDDARAEAALARAGSSPDVDADRAAVLLDEGKAHAALEALDAVLAKTPAHPQALFNRALALRDLDVPLAAAEAFERAAALGENGWADEARRRGAPSARATSSGRPYGTRRTRRVSR
jgi:hypothetical protein